MKGLKVGIKNFSLSILILGLFFISCTNSSETAIAESKKAQNPASTSDIKSVKNRRVTWYHDWDKGMAVAKREAKPVLIDFFAEWCKWCHVMDEQTFSAPGIKNRFIKSWITIRVNTEDKKHYATYDGKSMSYQNLSGYFQVKGLPSYLFIDKDGKPIYLLPGYVPKEQFGPLLDYMNDELYKKKVTFRDYLKSVS